MNDSRPGPPDHWARTHINPVIDEIYGTKQCEDLEGQIVDPFTASIPSTDGMVLYNNIIETKSRKTLETGMAYGMSTLFMCQALKDNGGGEHVAIDPEVRTTWRSVGILNVEKAGFKDMVRLYEAPSYQALPQLVTAGEKFDLAFIDGLHLFDAVLMDFFYMDKLLDIGGRIILHDTFMPSVRKALAFILRNTAYKPVDKHNGGLAMFWRWGALALRNLREAPFDVYSSVFLRRPHFKPNIFVIEKTAEDERQWDHYASF
jgi:predicted O-methyltransferase YrrM